jgi:hypothetical protein
MAAGHLIKCKPTAVNLRTFVCAAHISHAALPRPIPVGRRGARRRPRTPAPVPAGGRPGEVTCVYHPYVRPEDPQDDTSLPDDASGCLPARAATEPLTTCMHAHGRTHACDFAASPVQHLAGAWRLPSCGACVGDSPAHDLILDACFHSSGFLPLIMSWLSLNARTLHAGSSHAMRWPAGI